jgi:DNA modification methylase
VDVEKDVGTHAGDMAKINWTLRTFRLDDLTDYYKNPRSLSEKEFKQLKTSLDKFGMIDKPIVNLDSANTIIGGHQRKHVLEASGVKECECWIPDRELSEKEVEELNIRLNKNTGSWDFDTLANEFELDDLLDWGFDKGELDLDLWAEDAPEDVEPQIDKAEELRVKWGVESGQLWQLGEHRIVCGDCTDKAVVERVMGGEKADMVFTDPPYNVDYVGKTQDALTIENDSTDEIAIQGVRVLTEFINAGNPVYICFPAEQPIALSKMWNSPFRLQSMIVWAKDSIVMGRKDYQYKHEPIWYGWKEGSAHRWFGNRNQTTLWEIDRPKRNTEHPTIKPVEIAETAMRNSSEDGNIVVDPFLGSGTTLIACERLGRRCRAVEISPAYVAVAIQRWVDVTGGEPVLLDT